MNSCILMVKLIEDPQLRHARQQDGADSIEVTSVWVEFTSSVPDQPPMRLRVVGWRNTATEIKENYSKGDRAIVQGRLEMKTNERNGIKEKIAELVVSRVYPVEGQSQLDSDYQPPSLEARDSLNSIAATDEDFSPTSSDRPTTEEPDLDSIPF